MTGTSAMTAGFGAVKLAYVAAFAAAAILTFGSLARIGDVQDADTRRGLAWLLAGSGSWAASTVGFLLAPGPTLSVAFHTIGLVIGLSTVGAWLYFTSAYTSRSVHRNPTLRRIALAVFLLVVAVKVTNPIHGLYYGIEVVQTPFPHVAIQNGVLHWTVMGASYALSAIGYFMLFERFEAVSFDTTPLLVLVGLTGLPIVLDIAGFTSPALIDVTYEPIGVAVFATGLFFVFLDQFQAVRVAGERDDPVVALDTDDRIHQFNQAAEQVFPDRLRGAIGEPLESVFPDLAASSEEKQLVEVTDTSGPQYYRVATTPFTGAQTHLGRLLVFTDVTQEERARREQTRQNERLDRFTSTVSHDLRNPLTVARGRLEIAAEETDSEHVETALSALERMETMIEDLLDLARHGQPIDETEPVSLSTAATEAWEMVQTHEATLEVAGERTFEADPDRLASLFENLFRNAVEHAGPDVTVTVEPIEEGFAVGDDGPGIPPEERSKVLESGYSTADSGTGFGLAIVSEVADAHGWSVQVTAREAGGARFEFSGVN
ncbi:histidine kinase [Halodesulfurarchaeum formicicum]|uniref:histidine kinase n=1 Tax=Halodesulfurarchaeum formicicum TaxID=1873524 RepID=A0A1D8S6W1_9EURY|nr:ATP-binding protein [Halodesulfurarchaeum formicicum]AOW81068.1 histidine kinase [Halodesulfurarchaeum formicicum]